MNLKFKRILFLCGLQSTNDGTDHWWRQRISSVLILPLSLFFLIPLIKALGLEYSDLVELYKNPFRAVIAILFFGVAFKHLEQGLEVVIEDYIHDIKKQKIILLVNVIFCWLMAIAGILSVAVIFFIK
jgi:succinate dehydrogenase / fumarate reductase membrane anchor subunit